MNSTLYSPTHLEPLPQLWNASALGEGDLSDLDENMDVLGQRIKLEDEFSLHSPGDVMRPLSRTLCTPDLPHEESAHSAQVKSEVHADALLLNAPSAANQGQGSDAGQMDIYRELILRHLIQDISATCNKLGLPTNPSQWNSEHTNRWIREMCQQFQLPAPQNLNLDGKALLSTSQEQFCCAMPVGGDTLHAQLQLWKTAFESYSAACQPTTQAKPASTDLGELAPASTGTRTESFSSSGWSSPSSSHDAGDSDGSARGFGPAFASAQSSQLFFNSQPGHSRQNQAQTFFSMPYFASNGVNLPSPSDSDASSHSTSMLHDLDEEGVCATPFVNRNTAYPMASFNGLPSMAGGFNPYAAMDPAAQHPLQCASGSSSSTQFGRNSGTIHLWHFIREVLENPKQYGSCVRWVNREEGTFKIESSHHLARYWGLRKNRCQMNYDKLSRSLRQYYKKGIIQKPEKKQRLVYKFLPPYNL